MKTICLIIITIFYSLQMNAQLQSLFPNVVHDPINYSQLGLLLTEGAEQTVKIKEQISLLKDAKNSINIVNKALKKLDMIQDVIELSQQTITSIGNVSSRIKNVKDSDPELISMSIDYCMSNLNQATNNVAFLTEILSDNAFKLNDSERLEQIQKKISEMRIINKNVQAILTKIEEINSKANTLKSF